MKFSIITPTFKRPDELLKAVTSVITQSATDWEMIVVNDNPDDGVLDNVTRIGDARIRVFQNEKNEGVNYSRNRGLDAVSADSDYVIFLDDDDTLAPEALSNLTALITATQSKWLVTARGTTTTTPTTSGISDKKQYSYIWDYLIWRGFKGDATHCIATALINNNAHPLRFPTRIKQAEEWLLYAELGTYTHFDYEPIVTTLTPGYAASGLNYRTRTLTKQLRLIPTIVIEAHGRRLYLSPAFWIYVKMRIIRAFIK
jgi:glycosyltransferase involved in cell wall biosynthesis